VAHHIHFIDPYYFVSEQGIGPAEREKEMGFSHSCTSDPLDWSQVAQLLHNPIPVVGCMVRTLLKMIALTPRKVRLKKGWANMQPIA